ncbi:hypothetical protein OG693_39185 (plasmid) [Streptomyces sp. NBC_01259]|uniref:hypothetical protein n=1 Tax=Streptomyces sp. NBC_01259 TaxID=2903800 RepID=UPI002F915346
MLGDDTTAQRLRLLQAEFTQHVQTGPGDGRSATKTEAPAPIDLGVVDRIRAAVYEVEAHTRAAAPDTGRFTGDAVEVYDWAREHTADLDEGRQQAREAVIYRQGLEHALAMGDTTVIRKQFCPECGCLSLYWRSAARRAVCVQHYCIDKDGLANAWSLARLAREHVARKESSARHAT